MCKTNSEPYEPNDDDKRIAFQTLHYELNIFLKAYNILLLNKKNNPLNWALSDAIFESFLIHARNLYNFFARAERYKDDVLAIDYVSDWKENKVKISQKHNYISSNLVRIHKKLAHLTYSGPKLEKRFRVQKIYDEIQAFFIDFSINVDPIYLTEQWKNKYFTEFLQPPKRQSSTKDSFSYQTGGSGPISSKFSP